MKLMLKTCHHIVLNNRVLTQLTGYSERKCKLNHIWNDLRIIILT